MVQHQIVLPSMMSKCVGCFSYMMRSEGGRGEREEGRERHQCRQNDEYFKKRTTSNIEKGHEANITYTQPVSTLDKHCKP